LKKSPISRFHIFRFSKRKGTVAYFMAKVLKEPSETVKIKRAGILAELSRQKYERFLRENLGRTSAVLMLRKKVDCYQEGLLDNQLPVYIKVSKIIQPARLYKAKIIEYKKEKLFGKIV
jgi:tRNA A37 methylthiotransferase MiaB